MPTKPKSSDVQKSHLTIKQKIAIIQKKYEEPKWTQEKLGQWAKDEFHLAKQPTQATVSNILKTREQLMKTNISQDFCRVRAVKYPELDAAVHTWILSLERNNIKYSGEDVKEKALQLVKQMQLPTDLSFSNGWVSSFMERHQLKLKKNHRGDRNHAARNPTTRTESTPSPSSEPMSGRHSVENVALLTTQLELPRYNELLHLYAPRDIFSMDEVGLFYCLEPKKTKSRRTSLANSKSKVRITLTLAVNMDASEKLEQAFVGVARSPSSFQQQTAQELRFGQYYYNSNAWMTGPIFQDWVLQLNHAMLEQNRRILVLVDDAPSHVEMDLSNVRTLVLPPKRSHPFSVGVTRTFKTLFRIRHLAHAVDQAEIGETNVFEAGQVQAMRWAKQAWLEVSADTIRRCWDHTGLSRGMDAITSSSSSTSAVKIDQEMENAICGFLSHLNLLYQVSIESLLSPAGEDDVHYIYNDATINDLVMRKSGQDDGKHGEHAKSESASDHASSVKKLKLTDTQKATLYREVLTILDEEPEIDEELVHVMQFLRRKQAAVRQQVKQNQPPVANSASANASAVSSILAAPASSSSTTETVGSSTLEVEKQIVV